jgi:hypothetical protein
VCSADPPIELGRGDRGTIGLTELLVGVSFPVTPLEIMRFAVGPAVAGLALTGLAPAVRRASPDGLRTATWRFTPHPAA